MTLLHERGEKMAIRQGSICHQFFSIEWGQVGNYIQSVCNNTVITCDKSVAFAIQLFRLHQTCSAVQTQGWTLPVNHMKSTRQKQLSATD